MTLEELVDAIHKSGCEKVEVQHLRLMQGNKDQAGDYSLVRLTIGGKVVEFNNQSGAWVKS